MYGDEWSSYMLGCSSTAKSPRHPLIIGLGGLQVGLVILEREKYLLPLLGVKSSFAYPEV
jgi:hypothetical protein